MQRMELRVRQIRALYQRELTALHRDPNLDEETRLRQARQLWQQASDQLSALRSRAETQFGALDEYQRALFAAPTLPAELAEMSSGDG